MFLRVLEIVLIVAVIIITITQLIIPAYRGQKLFPLFRRQGRLENELAEAVQEAEESKVQSKINRTRKK